MATYAGLTWDGPFQKADDIPGGRSGIYLVCRRSDRVIVDVGEAGDVRQRLSTHDRKDCWARNGAEYPLFYVHYTPGATASDRRAIEEQVRYQAKPACGDR